MRARNLDVFLSYHTKDKQVVERLARKLSGQGITPWLDKWNLVPGETWQPAIEKALSKCLSFAACVGPHGSGPWQGEEMRAAIVRRVQTANGSFRVIPVLLPGGRRQNDLPAFLAAATWVEFKRDIDDDDEAFHRLVCGIRGLPPGELHRDSSLGPGRVQIAIEVRGTPEQFKEVSDTAQVFLRKVSGDATLTIKYLRSGSVIVVIECSEEGFELLNSSIQAGKLTHILDFEVQGLTREPVAELFLSKREEPGSKRVGAIRNTGTESSDAFHSSGRRDESQLIRAAQRGDPAAFEALVRHYDQAVLRLALHLVGSESDAQNIYQDAFLKAYRNIGNFRFECSFYTWIYRIVTNLCLDHLRKKNVRIEDEPLARNEDGSEYDMLDQVADGRAGASPERDLMRRDKAKIEHALSMLTPRERMVFELKHYHGLKLRTIGEVLHTTEETTKNTLSRATQRFVQSLRST
jgi:RNA polymerase sigma-70 factor, ECF subfamily